MILFGRISPRNLVIGRRWYANILKLPVTNDPRAFKTLLDPKAVALLNKYQDDILYASYAEENRRNMNYTHRLVVSRRIQREHIETESTESSSSVLARYMKTKTGDKCTDERIVDAGENDANEINEVNESSEATSASDENEERQNALAMARRKIFREMGFRTSFIENEDKQTPEHWMEDYETFSEQDITYDSHYGTPGWE